MTEQKTEPPDTPDRTSTGTGRFMEWRDSYRVDIAAIDQQHQGIVAMINEVHEAMLRQAPPIFINTVIRKLIAYAEEHFTFEEQCMELCGFKALAQHTCSHREMMKQIVRFEESIVTGHPEDYQKLLDFLMDWLRNHILRTDKEYVETLHNSGLR